MKSYVVYILRCNDQSLYTGITNDLENRLEKHTEGQGAKYVRSRLPVQLVYTEAVGKKGKALQREAEIKRLSKTAKENLVHSKTDETWWSTGIRFQCQGSGQCCLSRKGYGYVYLTSKDQQRLAKHLKLSLSELLQEFCNSHDGYVYLTPANPKTRSPLKETGCRFLKKKRCTIYKARPTQCRTWPFWPDNMNAKTWT
ncbi:MAG TPA: hypothetical protein DCS07_00455, partial [Bdellovibrionales bacterium]|nr:hypothetical protein [Bdellovibrionales bacterium]